jgi:probable rRNA maturation factor
MIVNRQRRVRVPIQTLNRFLREVCEILKQTEGAFTVCLVSEGEIARWNRAYRGKDGPTDVLSFPSNESAQPQGRKHRLKLRPASERELTPSRKSGSKSGDASTRAAEKDSLQEYLGDIAIAPGVALRNAPRFGRSFQDEMRVLILHGILHLMGYDHETDTGQMDRRERALRRTLGLA